jgi:sporulation protein YlmC with PRC-barrel domain
MGGSGQFSGKNISGNKGGASVMEVEDISVVCNFKKLKALNISNNSKIRDITALEGCKDMEEIYMNKCTNVEDVTVLGSLQNLNTIQIESCPKIKELYFLSELKNIKELKYNGTVVYSPSFLSNWKRSTNLDGFGGNDADPISKSFVNAAKKRVKRQKMLKGIFVDSKKKEDEKK